jgi:hypothetical protein
MLTLTRSMMVVGTIALAGCYEDSGTNIGDDETGTSTGQMGMSSTSGDETPGTSITQGSSPSTTEPDETTMTPDESGSSGDPSGYGFDDSPPEAYAQLDRIGMPGVGTVLITSKDEYNASTPFDDLGGTWIDEILGNLTNLHAALDDDLTGAGFVPCEPAVCAAQAGTVAIPDTIKITLDDTPGFPNGRLPTDTVMDMTLAVILLDLSQNGQSLTTLVGTNPTANDVDFPDDFPYFAERHV